MKRPRILAAALLSLGGLAWVAGTAPTPVTAQPAAAHVAAAQTTTFAIENMTCALCPVTVKTAMEGVAGVESVLVDFDAKTATVVFDPSVTSPEAIAAASTNAGYPASIKG
jgi:periplasmic mercuric ion binding protein